MISYDTVKIEGVNYSSNLIKNTVDWSHRDVSDDLYNHLLVFVCWRVLNQIAGGVPKAGAVNDVVNVELSITPQLWTVYKYFCNPGDPVDRAKNLFIDDVNGVLNKLFRPSSVNY